MFPLDLALRWAAALFRRPLRLCILAVLGAVGLWAAAGTVPGYFWLHRRQLDALVAEAAAVPGIVSLELGQDDTYTRGGSGRPQAFDSYRFINGMRVTHYREQVAPGAEQPVYFIDDLLMQLGVPAERYRHLREALRRLGLAGYQREGGQVTLSEPVAGGTPFGYAFVFSPDGREPDGHGVQVCRRLAPHWFYVMWG